MSGPRLSCCGVKDVAKMICILSHSSWGQETTSGYILGFLNFDIDTVMNTQYSKKGDILRYYPNYPSVMVGNHP